MHSFKIKHFGLVYCTVNSGFKKQFTVKCLYATYFICFIFQFWQVATDCSQVDFGVQDLQMIGEKMTWLWRLLLWWWILKNSSYFNTKKLFVPIIKCSFVPLSAVSAINHLHKMFVCFGRFCWKWQVWVGNAIFQYQREWKIFSHFKHWTPLSDAGLNY